MDRNRNLRGGMQAAMAGVGCVAFCIYSQAWQDWAHFLYDIPASFVVFFFIAQLVLDVVFREVNGFWVAKFIMLAAMTVVTVGRDFLGWTISGHLSCVLAVALVQASDRRLAGWERVLYSIPLPVVAYVRWFLFDKNGHAETINAVMFAVVVAGPVTLAGMRSRRRSRFASY